MKAVLLEHVVGEYLAVYLIGVCVSVWGDVLRGDFRFIIVECGDG